METLHLDAPHNYNQQNREAMYRFFSKHVLDRTDVNLKEKPIRVEKLQDMLALHNRTLPAGAVTLDGLFAEWVRLAKAQAAAVHAIELDPTSLWPTPFSGECTAILFRRYSRPRTSARLMRFGIMPASASAFLSLSTYHVQVTGNLEQAFRDSSSKSTRTFRPGPLMLPGPTSS